MVWPPGKKLSVANLERLNSSIPPTYTVFKYGSDYYAETTLPTATSDYSSNPATEIQYAFDNLTNRRTWQEKVLLKGDFTIDTTVYVSGYTILQIDGALRLADGSNCDIIQNKHPDPQTQSDVDWFIEIRDGILDGNQDNQTVGNGIKIVSAQRPHIINMRVQHCKQNGVYLTANDKQACGVATIENSYIYENYGKGVFVQGTSKDSCDHIIKGSNIGGNNEGGLVAHSSGNLTITGNMIWDNFDREEPGPSTADGISFYDVRGCTVTGNHLAHNGRFGITIDGSADWGQNIITGNSILDNSYETHNRQVYGGIKLHNTPLNIITSNFIGNLNTTIKSQAFAVEETGTSDYNNIQQNTFYYHNQYHPMQPLVGVHTKLRNNQYYYPGLPPNEASAFIASGDIFVDVPVAYVDVNSKILVTVVKDAAVDPAELPRVSGVNVGNQTFRVETLDGAAASQDISFYFEVFN